MEANTDMGMDTAMVMAMDMAMDQKRILLTIRMIVF